MIRFGQQIVGVAGSGRGLGAAYATLFVDGLVYRLASFPAEAIVLAKSSVLAMRGLRTLGQ